MTVRIYVYVGDSSARDAHCVCIVLPDLGDSSMTHDFHIQSALIAKTNLSRFLNENIHT
jgi:hypothetical protein